MIVFKILILKNVLNPEEAKWLFIAFSSINHLISIDFAICENFNYDNMIDTE